MFWIQSIWRKQKPDQTSLSFSRSWSRDRLYRVGPCPTRAPAPAPQGRPSSLRRSSNQATSSAVSCSQSGSAAAGNARWSDNPQPGNILRPKRKATGDRGWTGLHGRKGLWFERQDTLLEGVVLSLRGRGWRRRGRWPNKVGGSSAEHSTTRTTVQTAVGNMAGFQFKRNVYTIKCLLF